MKPRGAILLTLLCCALACAAPEPEAERRPTPPPEGAAGPQNVQAAFVDEDRDNLLDISRGNTVIRRTGELNLEYSALHAIDGMATTQWSTPPRGPEQSFVVALPGPARINRLGALLASKATLLPDALRFEASTDGQTWREVFRLEPKERGGRQIRDVEPFDATHLRVSIVEPGEGDVAMSSVLAFGTASPGARAPSFTGCWTINTAPSRLIQEANRIRGVLGGDRPTAVDGAVDGTVARLMWIRGPMWGYAAMTIAPDGSAISALTFHEEILVGNSGAAWFGEPCTESLKVETASPTTFLQHAGRWSMFGLAFADDGKLDPAASAPTIDAAVAIIRTAPQDQRFRLVSREYRQQDPAANRQVSAARLESLRQELLTRGVDPTRIEFVTAGSDSTVIEGPFAVMRLLASRVDLELVR